MSSYEQVLIFPPEIPSEQVEETLAKTRDLIEKNGGTILSQDMWGRRKTAYPLGKYREGFYVILQFTAHPAVVPDIEKLHRLNRRMIRHLTIKLDKPAPKKQVETVAKS